METVDGAAAGVAVHFVTTEERRLVAAFRGLPARERANLLAMMECYGEALKNARDRSVVPFPGPRAGGEA